MGKLSTNRFEDPVCRIQGIFQNKWNTVFIIMFPLVYNYLKLAAFRHFLEGEFHYVRMQVSAHVAQDFFQDITLVKFPVMSE